MPHLRLEYTSNLAVEPSFRELFVRLHRIVADVGGVDIGNCKSRAVERAEFLMGDGADAGAYVHLDLRILEGKTAAVKGELGRRLLEELRAAYAGHDVEIQVSVEIRDIVKDEYFKFPPLVGGSSGGP
jgi:5-carboxymethyl-2-hydroxymuconate isomerase